MRRLVPCFALLLTGCGSDPRLEVIATSVPYDLRQPEPGWLGPSPHNEGELADALVATVRGLERANAKIEAIDQILTAAEGGPQ
jgi:hypothetical protein